MHNKMREAVVRAVEEPRGEMVKLLAELIKRPSVAGAEGAAQELVERAYIDADLQVETCTRSLPDTCILE